MAQHFVRIWRKPAAGRVVSLAAADSSDERRADASAITATKARRKVLEQADRRADRLFRANHDD
jgi:hypothetical protein